MTIYHCKAWLALRFRGSLGSLTISTFPSIVFRCVKGVDLPDFRFITELSHFQPYFLAVYAFDAAEDNTWES